MLTSKLPNVGVTIFTQMSALAQSHQAINLSQGFPNFACSPLLRQRVNQYIEAGYNQYAPMAGIPELQTGIATLVKEQYQHQVDPALEVTVTSGATEALFVAIQAVVHAGDEVIVFDPAYDSYEPAVQMAGGRCIHIPLLPPEYGIDWQRVKESITVKTTAIIINNPHNPTGSILNAADIAALQAIVAMHDIYLIADEVYEHIVFDQATHLSVLRYPDLAQRSFAISSFGKTYHVTGWKVGYCIAPQPLTTEFRKIHQYVTFCTSLPMQMALADIIQEQPTLISELGAFYQEKRDILVSALAQSAFIPLTAKGTYFQCLDYSQVSDMDDVGFCHWLTKTHKIATIPISVFYQEPVDTQVIRVCFAKDAETLQAAGEILCQV